MTRRAGRLLWIGAGLLALALAILGIPLPLLPTTPLLLLTAFCFSRGSKRLHDWLLAHPKLGPPIHDWNENGAIPLRVKIISTGMMGAAILAAWAFGAPTRALIAQCIVMPFVGLFIWTRPSGPPATGDTVSAPAPVKNRPNSDAE